MLCRSRIIASGVGVPFLVLLMGSAACVSPALGAPLHIVTVGDLHTSFYSGPSLRNSFRSIGIETVVSTVPWPEETTASPTDAASLASRVLEGNPDAVVLMVGRLEAKSGDFNSLVRTAFSLLEHIDSFVTLQKPATQLIIAGNVPLLNDSAASDRLGNLINPWLYRQAANRNWLYVDLDARLKNIARWQLLYHDGDQLTTEGYDWMTVTVRNQIMELPFHDPPSIPEPATAGGLLLGGVILWLQRRGNRAL